MTVKQLIAKLKKMPQGLNVYWADHDHGSYEVNSTAGYVEHISEPDEDDDPFDYERYHKERKGYEDSTDEEYVVIRP